jgi:hypothetical protein
MSVDELSYAAMEYRREKMGIENKLTDILEIADGILYNVVRQMNTALRTTKQKSPQPVLWGFLVDLG